MAKHTVPVADLPSAHVLRKLFHYDPETGSLRRYPHIRNPNMGPEAKPDYSGYAAVNLKLGSQNRRFLAHRLIWCWMTGEWPVDQIDHINRIKSDNRWCNLREATRSQNEMNKIRKPGKSGVRGVTFRAACAKHPWKVTFLGKHVGYFATVEEAVVAHTKVLKAKAGVFSATEK